MLATAQSSMNGETKSVFSLKNPLSTSLSCNSATFLCLSNPTKLNRAIKMHKVNHIIENIVLSIQCTKKTYCQIKLESKTFFSNLQQIFQKGTLYSIYIVIFMLFTRYVHVIVLQPENKTKIHSYVRLQSCFY